MPTERLRPDAVVQGLERGVHFLVGHAPHDASDLDLFAGHPRVEVAGGVGVQLFADLRDGAVFRDSGFDGLGQFAHGVLASGRPWWADGVGEGRATLPGKTKPRRCGEPVIVPGPSCWGGLWVHLRPTR